MNTIKANEIYWDSTQVKRTRYFEDKNILEVEFKSGGVYHYADFPEELWDELTKCKSIGKFLNDNVKGIFSFTKIK